MPELSPGADELSVPGAVTSPVLSLPPVLGLPPVHAKTVNRVTYRLNLKRKKKIKEFARQHSISALVLAIASGPCWACVPRLVVLWCGGDDGSTAD